MKHIRQLLPHPKVRACVEYINNRTWTMFQYNLLQSYWTVNSNYISL
jgi:hypothetical protein